jgi:hypothetical protein
MLQIATAQARLRVAYLLHVEIVAIFIIGYSNELLSRITGRQRCFAYVVIYPSLAERLAENLTTIMSYLS